MPLALTMSSGLDLLRTLMMHTFYNNINEMINMGVFQPFSLMLNSSVGDYV